MKISQEGLIVLYLADDPSQKKTVSTYSLDLEEARKIAGYPLRQKTGFEGNLVFSGVNHAELLDRVTFQYLTGIYDLYFSQRPIGSVEEYSKIGASAPVEIVTVGGVAAEYVHGGWKILSTESQAPVIDYAERVK